MTMIDELRIYAERHLRRIAANLARMAVYGAAGNRKVPASTIEALRLLSAYSDSECSRSELDSAVKNDCASPYHWTIAWAAQEDAAQAVASVGIAWGWALRMRPDARDDALIAIVRSDGPGGP